LSERRRRRKKRTCQKTKIVRAGYLEPDYAIHVKNQSGMNLVVSFLICFYISVASYVQYVSTRSIVKNLAETLMGIFSVANTWFLLVIQKKIIKHLQVVGYLNKEQLSENGEGVSSCSSLTVAR